MFEVIQERIHKYRQWEPLVFFAGGFIFDAALLHRIDNPVMLVHQAVYLTFSALIIAWDLFAEAGRGNVPRWLGRIWRYREGVLHFMLGTLLNVYTIFYFKSGSFVSSISFLVFLGLLLFLNEVRPSNISKHVLRNALFSLCLISYMNIVVSIAVGSTGVKTFLLAIVAAGFVLACFLFVLRSRIEAARLRSDIALPFGVMAAVYVLLYVFKVLPPVPLSVRHIGIYRSVSKEGDKYRLGFEHPLWEIWQNGDQHFKARAGDKIFCFVQVFSPTRFRDQLFVRWRYHDARLGWQSWDAIPINIVGGREEGYRGYTVKTNYQPGPWRVSIETLDGREVGRIHLDIEATSDPEPSSLNYDLR